MFKKIKIAVLAAITLLVISGAAFARGGHDGNRGCDGGRYYRPTYRHCDYRPIYREYRPVRARPVYVYPSRGIFISPFIVIGF